MTASPVIPLPPAPSRMNVSSIVSGRVDKPMRVLLYGVEKIGKSTFGAAAPSPVFLCSEDGTSQLDVARFPEPRSWREALDAIAELASSTHPYKTIVVDTLDWLEPLCWAHVCERAGKSDIEAFGYGKGFTAALDEWRIFLAALERARSARSMGVILLAHSWIKPFKNPEGEDYDRFEMKIHLKTGGLIKEWCDAVLFATYESYATKKGDSKAKGISTGARIVHTQRRAAWDAGNRYNLPETIALDWATFEATARAGLSMNPAAIKLEIEQLLAAAPESEFKAKVLAWLGGATNALELTEGLNRVRAHLAQPSQK